MKTKIFSGFLFVLVFLVLINSAAAQSEVIDIDNFKNIAISIHILELVLALFICYRSLKFFRITKPLNLFLFVYIALVFFIISSLLYLFLYLSLGSSLDVSFVNVYLGSRIALMGMITSFAMFFYQWNKVMRKTEVK